MKRWGIGQPDPRPFARASRGYLVLPERADAALAHFWTLLIRELPELETTLGAPVEVIAAHELNDTHYPRCLVGPASRNFALQSLLDANSGLCDGVRSGDPFVWIDRDHGGRVTVIVAGESLEETGEALNLLWTAVRTAVRTGAELTTPTVCTTASEILAMVTAEVEATWPSFSLRGIDWPMLLDLHRQEILGNDADLISLQRLMAELGDAHTWVKDRRINARAPYRTWSDGTQVFLSHVPRWSTAWKAGVRAGDELIDHDGAAWWSRTAATCRTKPVVTGYRMLAGTVGEHRAFRARTTTGKVIEWQEEYRKVPWQDPVSWSRRPSGTGYLRIRGWQSDDAWQDAIDVSLRELASSSRLIVDLRGNVGGNLVAAQQFRDRFLTRRTHLGTIRFSRGDGTLSPHHPIVSEPPAGVRLWNKRVRFLVDRESFSATEDALLGLHGLSHVELVGEATGGGSGRPRLLPLRGDLALTISMALTYDRHGRCIEGNGLPVDRPLPVLIAGTRARGFGVRPRPCLDAIDLADRGW